MTFARNGWYCAGFTAEIADKPIARRILGDPIMLVRDTAGDVRAIGDRCPHRFAPLHLGAIDSDTIECPYHGLKFDLNGACILNPGKGAFPQPRACPLIRLPNAMASFGCGREMPLWRMKARFRICN